MSYLSNVSSDIQSQINARAPATSGTAILKGDGAGGFSSTTAGTDYMRPGQVYVNTVSIANADSPYTVASTAAYILCNATAGAVVINLPAATGTGREITVKKTDSSSNACTPTRAGSDTIDGATSYSLTTQYASSKVVDAASGSWHRSHVNQLGGDLSGISTNATVASIGGKAVSLANSFTTSGNYALTLTQTGATNVTLPTTGTLVGADVTGNVVLSGYLQLPVEAVAIKSSDTKTRMWFGANAASLYYATAHQLKDFGSNAVVFVPGGVSHMATGSFVIGTTTAGATLDVAKTNTITARFYDQTATTGTTRVVLRAGAGDASGNHLLSGYLNDGTTEKWYITRDGVIKSGGYKSSDGTAGVTVTTCTGFKDGLCISGT